MNVVMQTFGRAVRPLFGTGIGRIPGVVPVYKWAWKQFGQKGIALTNVGDLKMYVDCADWAVAPSLVLAHSWERAESELIINNVNQDSIFIDIGAHIGYFTLLMSKYVNKVISFEPTPATYELLDINVKVNKITNVELHQLALSDKAGEASLHLDNVSPASNSFYGKGKRAVMVKMDKLDNFVQYADFIKMDVEGNEFKVVQGMTELIKNSPQLKLLTEVYPEGIAKSGVSVKDYVELLERYFKLYTIDGKPTDIKSIIHQTNKAGSINVFCRRKND